MLKWAGKICRMSDGRLVKCIFDNVDHKWTGRGKEAYLEEKNAINFTGILFAKYL